MTSDIPRCLRVGECCDFRLAQVCCHGGEMEGVISLNLLEQKRLRCYKSFLFGVAQLNYIQQ